MAAVMHSADNSAEGKVVHIRVPTDLHELMTRTADVEGRSFTQHALWCFEVIHLGLRVARLVRGDLPRN